MHNPAQLEERWRSLKTHTDTPHAHAQCMKQFANQAKLRYFRYFRTWTVHACISKADSVEKDFCNASPISVLTCFSLFFSLPSCSSWKNYNTNFGPLAACAGQSWEHLCSFLLILDCSFLKQWQQSLEKTVIILKVPYYTHLQMFISLPV